jgi:hypothetical protein
MTIAKDVAAKFAIAIVAVAMVFAAFAPSAKAQTTEDLQKMINDLLAQVASLQSQLGQEGAASAAGVCPYTWTRDLNTGATGADVKMLQQFLNADADTRVAAEGVGSAGMETETYGPMTAAAVSKFQVKYRADILSPANLVNPTGYFGPSTRAKANALCVAPAAGEDTEEGEEAEEGEEEEEDMELSGEASLEDTDLDDAADSDLEEGNEDAEVGTLTLTFENGDAEISRIDVTLLGDGETNTNTVEPWEAFETVSLWVDGDKVAEVDASDEDEYLDEDDGSVRFSGLDIVAMEDEDVEVVVAVSVQNNLDSAELITWDLDVTEVRYFDADGVASTDLISVTAVEFTIDEAGAEDELSINSSTNDPDSTTIQVEDDSNSDWTTIFAFELDTEDSVNDIMVEGLRVDVAATEDGTTATSTAFLIDDAQLVIDGVEYDDVTITHGTTGQFVFDLEDEDLVIDAGEAVEVEFQVEFEPITELFEGATVEATVDTDGLEAEGADTLTTGDNQLSGSATGEEHTLRTEGAILATDEDATELKINDDADTTDDEGVFTISFEVTAFETDIYVNKSAASGTAMGTAGASFLVEDSNGNPVGAGTSSASLTSTADTDGTRFIVEEGETETFTLTVEYDPATAAFYQLQLYSLNFNNSNADPDTQQRALDESDYQTDALSI